MGAQLRKLFYGLLILIAAASLWTREWFPQENSENEESVQSTFHLHEDLSREKISKESITLHGPSQRLPASGILGDDHAREQSQDLKKVRLADRQIKKSRRRTALRDILWSDGKSYRVLEGFGAVMEKSKIPAEHDWEAFRGGYWIFHVSGKEKSRVSGPVGQQTEETSILPVVAREGQKELSVVTGHLLVTPRQMSDLSTLAQEYGLELVQRFDHLKWAAVKPKNSEALFEKWHKLTNDSRVEKVEIDILETAARVLKVPRRREAKTR